MPWRIVGVESTINPFPKSTYETKKVDPIIVIFLDEDKEGELHEP